MLNKTIFAKAKSISYLVVVSVMVFSNLSLAPNIALADPTSVNISVATGGDAVSIDTSSASSSSAYTTLDPINISETDPSQIAVGTHVVNLPAGWEFNTSAHITAFKGDGLALASYNITPDLNSFSFTVTTPSTVSTFLMLSGMQVRPTGTTPSTGGEITHSGAVIAGVTDGSTSFGTLSTVAGTVAKVVFAIQPSASTVYGSAFSAQPVVKTQDQFDNDSSTGASGKTVTLSLTSGPGAITGTNSLDISSGTATFSGLSVDTIGTYQILAQSDGLVSATSDQLEVTPRTLTATVAVGDKIYDGGTSATITNVTLDNMVSGDNLTVTNNGTANFVSAGAGTGISVTSSGVVVSGSDLSNYTFDNTATGAADINPMSVTITPTASQAKVYGNSDPALTYSKSDLIGDDTISGVLGRVAGGNVGSYAYTLGDLSAGPNYLLSLAEGIDTFSITKRPLTIEPTASSKIYDGGLTSGGIPTIVSGSLADGDVANFVQVYSTTNVGAGKKLTPSGTAGGNDGNNYEYDFDYKMNGTITPKELTVSGLSASDKTYNGNTDVTINGTPSLMGVVGADDVVLDGTALGQFDSISVGENDVVVSGLSISGTGVGNYTLAQPVLTAEILPLNITGSFTAADKIYDGTTTAEILTRSLIGVLGLDDDNVSLVGGTASFSTRNVGTDLVVTSSGMTLGGSAAGNYNLTSVDTATADITVKNINVTAQADTKVYDGSVTSSVVPVVDTLESGDSVGTAPTQTFDDEDVGTGKALTPSGLVINDGNSGANYDVTYVLDTTGAITTKGLTVSGVVTTSKVYDGITTAAVNFAGASLTGVVAGDEAVVSLDYSGYSALFDNKNVDTGKTVTISGLSLAGTGKNNYSLTQPVLNDGVITKKTLTVTAAGNDRVYDATDTATVVLSSDKVAGDDLTLAYEAVFSDGKNVGENKPISVTNIAIAGGTDQGNYLLGNTTTSTTADITQAPLTATVNVNNKVVDGNNTATITGVTLNGRLLTDVVTVNSQGTATFASATVGTHSVTATDVTITGADAGNYSFGGTATGSGNILPIPTTVYVDDSWTGTTAWTDPDGAGSATFFGYDAFITIQEAVTAVASDGAINVAAGTYNLTSRINVNKAVNITGDVATPANVAINAPVAGGTQHGQNSVFMITSSDVTIQGFRIQGALHTGAAQNAGIYVDDPRLVANPGLSNITISSNEVTDNGYGIFVHNIKNSTISNNKVYSNKKTATVGMEYDAGSGIVVYGRAEDNNHTYNLTIDNNQVYSNETDGIRVDVASDVGASSWINDLAITISNNIIYSNGRTILGADKYIGIKSAGMSKGVTVSGNEIYGHAMNAAPSASNQSAGIWIAASNDWEMNNNNIHENTNGIYFLASTAVAGSGSHVIVDNDIHANIRGISIDDGNEAVANDKNSIYSNDSAAFSGIGFAPYEVYNRGSGVFDATQNWWGTTDATAISSKIAGDVDYRPWCADESCNPLDDASPSVAISSSQDSPTNSSSVTVLIDFNEDVYGFTADDITVGNGIKGTLSGSGSSYTINVTPSADGSVTVDVGGDVAWDLSGNYNTAATQFSIVYDGTAPTGSVTSPTADTEISGVITIEATAEDGTGSGVQKVEFWHSSTDTLIGEDGSSPYLISWDSTLVSEGAHELYVKVYDNAGNSYTSAKVGVVIDRTAPTAELSGGPAVLTNITTTDITVGGAGITHYKYKLDSESYGSQTAVASHIELSGLAAGSHTIYVIGRDLAGNWQSEENAVTHAWTIDTTAPTVTSRSPAVNAVGIDPSINITVTFDEAMDSLTTVSGGLTLRKGDVEVSTSVTYDAGTKTMTINPTVTLDNNSTYVITLLSSMKDVAGNALSQTSWSFTTSASYSISLTKGWNLISLPVVPNDKDTADVLGSNSANIQSVYAYDSENGTWLVYHPSNPETSNLMTMTAGYGYWIDYTSDTPGTLSGAGNLLLEGNNVPPSRTLKSGWNLVGYYQKENTITAQATNALKHNLNSYWTMLVSYNNTSKQMSYKAGTDVMNPGEGFWVLLSGKATDTYIYTLGDAD